MSGRGMTIKTAIRLKNNMVMVFDADGEQLPSYQGQYEDVKISILEDAPTDAVLAHWFGYTTNLEPVSREAW